MNNETKIKTDNEILKESVKAAIPKRYPSASPELLDKVNSMVDNELAIIKKAKCAKRILISAELVAFAKSVGKMPYEKMEELQNKIECMDCAEIEEFVNANSTEPGEAVAPGYGVLVGSIVSYLLGITNVDPLEYNFIFERALSPDGTLAPVIIGLSSEAMKICNVYLNYKYETESIELIEFQSVFSNITAVLRKIKENHGIEVDINDIAAKKKVFEEIYIKGNTDNIYLFRNDASMKNNAKKIRPKTMKELACICAFKYYESPIMKLQKYIVPDVASILDETQGMLIYQEQLMGLLMLAGFSATEANNIRKYIAKRQTKKYAACLPQFITGYEKLGAKREDIIEFWNSITSYSCFAVSKPHVAAMTTLSYQTAWLKYHYPKEFSDCFATN